MAERKAILSATLAVAVLMPFVGVAACQRSGQQAGSTTPAPPAQSAQPAGEPGPLRPIPSHPPVAGMPSAAAPAGGEMTWTVPDVWTSETPSSSMRRAQYRLPAPTAGGGEGECVVFYFGPGQGGDVRGNIDRWASQFSTPGGAAPAVKVSEIKAGGRTITRVELKGTYHPSPMGMTQSAPPSEQPGYAFLGAIVPGADANWFFKCAGPEKTIDANRDRFDRMLASIRPAG